MNGQLTTTSSAYPPGRHPQVMSSTPHLQRDGLSALLYDEHTLRIREDSPYYLRPTTAEDRKLLEQLHREWFPINYHDEYYDCLQTGAFESLILDYRRPPRSRHEDNVRDDKDPPPRAESASNFFQFIYGFFQPAPQLAAVSNDLIAAFACTAYDRILADEDIVRLYTDLVCGIAPNYDQTVLANAVYQCYYELSAADKLTLRQKAAYIVTLGVTAEFRRKGIATYLLKRIKREIISRGKIFLYLHVITYNTDAIQMYSRYGFRLTDTLEDYYDIDGARYDAYLAVWQAPCNIDQTVSSFVDYVLDYAHTAARDQNVSPMST